MTDDRKSGIALIAGSLGLILTMAEHPVAAKSLTIGQQANLSTMSGIAHSLAIVSGLALFLGGCGLTRRVASADRVAFAAIVTYGFASVALLIAATVSGFVVPNIMKQMLRDVPANAHQWEIVIDGIFQINQAFARILSVTSTVAIILWSVSALRNGGFGHGVAIYGCIISVLIVVGVAAGHLRLDIHGMGTIALGQAIWFIIVGSQLCFQRTGRLPAS